MYFLLSGIKQQNGTGQNLCKKCYYHAVFHWISKTKDFDAMQEE